MNKIKYIIAVILLATGLSVPIATGTVEAALYNCTTMEIYETGYARCMSGTGTVAVRISCRLASQTWFFTGPTVGRGVWSQRSCPYPHQLTDTWYWLGFA